ncbi:MAG: hypothetical protein ABSE28_17880 [Candidatus Sulfotelmatobacter sp.]|jgi:hypothetical protein
MSKLRHNQPALPLDAALFAGKPRKPVPHEFVLDAIAPLSPETRPMFGCLAIYVGEKIVLILRDKPTYTADNGVWLATTEEHHLSLLPEFPNMRSIGLLGKKVTGWQVLPVDAPDFEEAALHACDLVLAGDPRIGKVPASRRASKAMSRKAVSRKAVSRKAVSRKGTNSSKPASALGSSKSRKKKSSRSSKS